MIEIVIVLGLFAIMASFFASILIASFSGILRGEEYLKAESMIREGEAAIISIKKRDFNEFIYNESSVISNSGHWELSGEGDSYEEDGFLRQIYFYDVYRDADGAYSEEGGSGTNDSLSKKVLIKISWQSGNKNLSIEREFLISAW